MNELNILLVGLNLSGDPPTPDAPGDLGRDVREMFQARHGGPVHTVTEDMVRCGSTVLGMSAHASNLFTWFFWPLPDFAERERRWANLRGEAGTVWDWIVLTDDPDTLLRLPGFHAAGVAAIQKEVAKGGARLLLCVPPAEGRTEDEMRRMRHVVHRVGQSAGIPVAGPAPDSAPAVKDFPNPFAILGDRRQSLYFSHKGSSTERDLTAAVHAALATLNIAGDSERFTGTYNSETPLDDGLGWPVDAELPIAFNLGRHPAFVDDGHKGYVTNPEFWQLGFAFAYQHFAWEHPLDDANAHFIAMTAPLDFAVARQLRGEDSARAVPLRALWALIQCQYPGERYQRDRVHLNLGLLKAAGVFIVTLYTGGKPVQTVSTDPAFAGKEAYDLFCQRTGHALALQLGQIPITAPPPP